MPSWLSRRLNREHVPNSFNYYTFTTPIVGPAGITVRSLTEEYQPVDIPMAKTNLCAIKISKGGLNYEKTNPKTFKHVAVVCDRLRHAPRVCTQRPRVGRGDGLRLLQQTYRRQLDR